MTSLWLVRVLAAVLVVATLVEGGDKSGGCGNGVSFTLSGGVLTISGNGTMDNWSETSAAPWYEDRETIERVVIEQGVNSIGTYAFASLSELTSVSIPDSVNRILDFAFSSCVKLQTVTLPALTMSLSDIGSIGTGAFYGCTQLKSVFYPGTLIISSDALKSCSALEDVCVLPDYRYPSVGGKNVTVDTTLCQEFQRLSNKCYKAVFVDDSFVQQKYTKAQEWEDSTLGCNEHKCDNQTGLVSSILCLGNEECTVDGRCVRAVFIIDIEFDERVSIGNVTASDLASKFSALLGKSVESKAITVENDEGQVRASVELDIRADAITLVERINEEIDKGPSSCAYGVLCFVKSLRFTPHPIPDPVPSDSVNSQAMVTLSMCVFIISFLVLLF